MNRLAKPFSLLIAFSTTFAGGLCRTATAAQSNNGDGTSYVAFYLIQLLFFFFLLGALPVMLLIRAHFKKRMACAAELCEKRRIWNFLVGASHLVFLYVIMLVIGRNPLIVLPLFLMALLCIPGLLAMSESIGNQIGTLMRRPPSPLASILIGTATFFAMGAIPLLGQCLQVFLLILGVGAFIRSVVTKPSDSKAESSEPPNTPLDPPFPTDEFEDDDARTSEESER